MSAKKMTPEEKAKYRKELDDLEAEGGINVGDPKLIDRIKKNNKG